jgi:hypothetical protein
MTPVYVCAFEGRDPEAWARKTSSVPRENEINIVCMATRDLNSAKFQPTDPDPGQCDVIMQGVRIAIERHIAACPGFANQLKQLLVNKEWFIEMTLINLCWKCGQPGHVRARCLMPRPHYDTDFRK